MLDPKRLVTLLSSVLTLGVGAVLVLSATASGSTALRTVANNLAVSAHAATGDAISLTIDPRAPLTAKLAASVSVSYTCQPAFDPTTGNPIYFMSSFLYVQVQQRQGKTIARGSGFITGNAVCDNITVNQATVVVVPDFFPGLPFKNGVALASVNANACVTQSVSSPPFNPCEFGSAGPTAISIK